MFLRPIWRCGYDVCWLCRSCCMAIFGSHFLFSHRFVSSLFLCRILNVSCRYNPLDCFTLLICLRFWHVVLLSIVSLDVYSSWWDDPTSLSVIGYHCRLAVFWFSLVLWRLLGHFVSVYLLSRVIHPFLIWVWMCVAIGRWFDCCHYLVWEAWCCGVSSWECLLASRFCCLCDSATTGEFMVLLCRHVRTSLYAWVLSVWCFRLSDFLLSCLGVDGMMLDRFFLGCLPALQFWCRRDSATVGEFMEPSPGSSSAGSDVWRCSCSLNHRWELPVLRYHKIMVIYPYPFLW